MHSPSRPISPVALRAAFAVVSCALGVHLARPTEALAGTARDAWALVAAYDMAAVMAADVAPRSDFTWQPRPAMEAACGPVKMPQGMGIMEAEAMAAGLGPTLALVLERPAGHEQRLTIDEVQVALAKGPLRHALQPAVVPRDLEVSIEGDADERFKQLIRTQIAMETCMEHKVGRAWRGSDGRLVRQAFLLEPPGAVGDRGPARMFFGGQWQPVSALLGPPAACESPATVGVDPNAGLTVSKGEGSALLVPTDVWGATLAPCAPVTGGAARSQAHERLPLRLSAMAGDEAAPQPRGQRVPLRIRLDAGEVEPRIEVTLGEAVVLPERDLFSRLADADPDQGGDAARGLTDVLAFVPYELPTVGPRAEPDRYTLVLIPNWQLRDRFKAMALAAPQNEELDEARRAENAVTWLLEHPEYLVLQVADADAVAAATRTSLVDRVVDRITALLPTAEEGEQTGPRLPTLSTVLGAGGFGVRDWGFIVGQDRAHTPVALPIAAEPTRAQALTAHRAWNHGAFLLFALVGGTLCALGLRRIPDLWTSVPEERATYWPGRRTEAAGPQLGSSSGPPGDAG